MMRRLSLGCLCVLVLLTRGSFAEETPAALAPSDLDPVEIPEGIIGVVVAQTDVQGKPSFRLVLAGVDAYREARPKERLQRQIQHDFTIFDQRGVLATIPRAAAAQGQWSLENWCENDGGARYRPELQIDARTLGEKRALRPSRQADGVSAFVYYGPAPQTVRPLAKPLPRFGADPLTDGSDNPEGYKPAPLYLSGVLDPERNGSPVARVIETYASYTGCGAGFNQEDLQLETAERTFHLRCCGP